MPPHSLRRRRAAIAIALAVMSAPAYASTPPLDWHACDRPGSHIEDRRTDVSVLCASMTAPRDYAKIDGQTVPVQVMRVRFGDQLAPRDAIFFNFGGPGSDPRVPLEFTTGRWIDAAADDELMSGFHAVARRFDLVTVVPRGLDAQRPLVCDFDRELPLTDLYEDRDSNKTWRALIDTARRFAERCGADPMNVEMNTRTHVEDIETFRTTAGYGKLSFFGSSYGTTVALWYGALYPGQVKRMMLDAVVDIRQTWEAMLKTGPESADSAFMDSLIQPAVEKPSVYGLGTRNDVLLGRLMRMPLWLRMAWQNDLHRPADLIAALTLSDWLVEGMTIQQVGAAIPANTYSVSPDIHRQATQTAHHLYGHLARSHLFPAYANDFDEEDRPTAAAVNLAIQCNDTPWDRHVDTWRRFILNRIGWSFNLGEGHILTSLTCAQWPRHAAALPDFRELAKLPPVLVVHGEYDRRTPWSGAQATMTLMPKARALLARGYTHHGVVNDTRSRCIEYTVAQYLLNGRIPAREITHCPVDTP